MIRVKVKYMHEEEVVSEISDYLIKENYEIWIDSPHYPNIKDKYPQHHIQIGGFIPDIIGLNIINELVAVEVKGEVNIAGGIGQAATYLMGVHKSYIGAPKSKLKPLTKVALNTGIGVFCVEPQKVEVIEPNRVDPRYLTDVQREIRILKIRESESTTRISSLTRNHPLNYIAPLFAFDLGRNINEVKIEVKKVGVNQADELVRGAKILGLIREENGLIYETEEGLFLKFFLSKMNCNDILELKELKNKTIKKRSIKNISSELATALKLIYLKEPDFSEFVNFITKVSKNLPSFTMVDLCEEILNEQPNLFLNFLCPRDQKIREEILNHLKNNKIEDIIKPNNLKKYVLQTIFYTMKTQLRYLGIINENNTAFYKPAEEYNPEEDIWKI